MEHPGRLVLLGNLTGPAPTPAAGERAAGRRGASAVTQFVVKLHSRCDLACDHCYIYEHGDEGWRGRPLAMSAHTVKRVAQRIAEHAAQYALPRVRVTLHGGEPLLLGPERMASTIGALQAAVDPVARLDMTVVTNAVRLSPEYCEVFDAFGVAVAVSLDGDRTANDLHRRFADGRSSHEQVLDGLRLLREPRYRHLYAGILCTVDTRNDPGAVYEALLAQDPPRIDFLLPHGTWDNPPARTTGSATEYAHWLLAIYERRLHEARPVPVRLFDSLEATALGGHSLTEALGTEPVDLLVIETDGTYEQVDSLKAAYDGAAATGTNVFAHSVATAAAHPGVQARRTGVEGLCATCRACPVVERCGGGLYPHRYRKDSGFDNPSVYCADLKLLVESIPPPGRPATPRDSGQERDPQDEPLPIPGPDPASVIDTIDSAEGVDLLAWHQAQVSRAVATAAARTLAEADPGLCAAWELLVRLDSQDPRAVDQVFRGPHVRAWFTQCLEPGGGPVTAGPRAYLGALAAAAAIRAGDSTRLTVRAYRGRIHLPGVGTVILRDAREAIFDIAADGFCVTADETTREIRPDRGPRAAEGWLALHWLRTGETAVALDDRDPYRDKYEWPATRGTDDGEARAWERATREAFSFLDAQLPAVARGLRAGLHSVVPLTRSPDGRLRSATARHGFGTVAVARPEDALSLALLLAHEFQHVKLNALLGMTELYDSDDRTLYTVPWREDARPLGGVLHGAYAHTAVCAHWAARAAVESGAARDRARREAARWYRHTDNALTLLQQSGKLTRAGEQLVAHSRDALAASARE